MTWTNIPDTNIEPGKPVRSIDMIAMRDNIPALANGDAGAPRIKTAAIDAGQVTASKLATGTDERDWVLGRTAGATHFYVGTYSVSFTNNAQLNIGVNYSGASIGVPSGTWKVMSHAWVSGSGESFTQFSQLILRVA